MSRRPFRLPYRSVVAGVTVAAWLAGAGTVQAATDVAPAGHRAAADAPAVSAPDPVVQTVVTEGQVKEAGPGGVIRYPSVTSCLTVTVHLRAGGAVGAHASLFQVPGELRSDQILGRVRSLVAARAVTDVEVRGAVGAWHPSYFIRAIESYGEGEEVPVPEGADFAGLNTTVAKGLRVPGHTVTVKDVPDGDQVVEVPAR